MESSYRIIKRSNCTLDELQAHNVCLQINRTGAEMISLQKKGDDGAWRSFLYRDGLTEAPASGWGNHATVMGYYIHRLWEGKSQYCNERQPILGGTHGVIRHYEFTPPVFKADTTSLIYYFPVFKLDPYQFAGRVCLRLTYQILESGSIKVTFDIENMERVGEAYVSFGLHPGWQVTSLKDAIVHLSLGRYVRLMAPGDFLNGETQTIEHPGGAMPFSKADLPGSYLLDLAGVPERIFSVEDPVTGQKVILDFGDCPYLTLWSNGDQFICIEPCWGLPDSNPPVHFEKKLGIQTLPPHGSIKTSFLIHPSWTKPEQ